MRSGEIVVRLRTVGERDWDELVTDASAVRVLLRRGFEDYRVVGTSVVSDDGVDGLSVPVEVTDDLAEPDDPLRVARGAAETVIREARKFIDGL